MPRFFFTVHDGADIADETGTELASIDEARIQAVTLAAQLLKDNPKQFWNGHEWQMIVTDKTGLIFFTLNFMAVDSPAN